MKIYVKCDGPCNQMAGLETNQALPPRWKRVQVMGEVVQLADVLYCDKCFPSAIISAATEIQQQQRKVKQETHPDG